MFSERFLADDVVLASSQLQNVDLKENNPKNRKIVVKKAGYLLETFEHLDR